MRPNNESTIWAENVFSAKFIIHWDTFLKNKRETGTDSTLDNTLFALFSSLKSLTDNSKLSALENWLVQLVQSMHQMSTKTAPNLRWINVPALCKFWEYLPHIVSAETILCWLWPYVLWPLVTVHKSAETIQGRKLFKGGNYMRKYGN